MKNLIIILLLFTSVSFSQEIYTFKSGGRVFENNERLNSIEVNKKFSAQPEIIKLYNNGRNRKTFGNILLWGGIGTAIGKFLYEAATPTKKTETQTAFGPSVEFEYSKNTLFYVGGAFVLIAIPIKIGFQKKIKKSIILMNEEVKLQKQTAEINFETNIIANANGVGFKLTF
jgi:hypothetical protein